MKITDLVKLNFYKNDKGEYHDPVSFKVFTDYTKIVAIKTSGTIIFNMEVMYSPMTLWKNSTERLSIGGISTRMRSLPSRISLFYRIPKTFSREPSESLIF